jgi:hypothetical protein
MDRPSENRVHLPLNMTVVRGLIIFRAVEIGVETTKQALLITSCNPLSQTTYAATLI